LEERRRFDQSAQVRDLTTELEQAFVRATPVDTRQRLVLRPDPVPFTQAQLAANPALILDLLSEKQSRFSELDIKRSLAEHLDHSLNLRSAIDTVLRSKELVALSGGETPDFTTKSYQKAEADLFHASDVMAMQHQGVVVMNSLNTAIAAQNVKMRREFGGALSEEQITATPIIAELMCPFIINSLKQIVR